MSRACLCIWTDSAKLIWTWLWHLLCTFHHRCFYVFRASPSNSPSVFKHIFEKLLWTKNCAIEYNKKLLLFACTHVQDSLKGHKWRQELAHTYVWWNEWRCCSEQNTNVPLNLLNMKLTNMELCQTGYQKSLVYSSAYNICIFSIQ